MLKLSINDMIDKINNLEVFEAICEDNSFSIHIETYVPYICLAIHNGGNLREELRNKIALTKMERWYEEDPNTAQFISSLPIRILAYDSRYEYDLNRSPKDCIYNEAWGKEVWKEPLTKEQIDKSINKHNNFYKVVEALVGTVNKKFRACILYDIHSYNYQKEGRYENAPLFNVGTEKITDRKHKRYVNTWLRELRKIQLASTPVTVEENKVFFGRGYLLANIMTKFPKALVLATEIKKVYIDEINGDEYPEVITNLQKALKLAILNHASVFAKSSTNMIFDKKFQLLSSELTDNLKDIDNQLYTLLKKVEILNFINPVNIETEKKKVIASKFKYTPVFRYKPLPFETNQIKKTLYKLPTEKIKDVHLRMLYEDIIDYYSNKLDLLTLRGKESFLYSSLLNFGGPDQKDIDNANFILHCQEENAAEKQLTAVETSEIILQTIKRYGFKCHIALVKNLASGAMVVNSTRTLKLRKEGMFPESVAYGLAYHEIGIHMLTTFNALNQPLKFLRLSLPEKTLTQEGLAILSEYLSGYLGIKRLKQMALRVIVINLMIKGFSFLEVLTALIDKYNLEHESAFYLTTRAFRGGGFTKDFLYLKGFIDTCNYYDQGNSLESLLIGKTSIKYKSVLEELIARELLNPPKYLPDVFRDPSTPDKVTEFIIKSLK